MFEIFSFLHQIIGSTFGRGGTRLEYRWLFEKINGLKNKVESIIESRSQYFRKKRIGQGKYDVAFKNPKLPEYRVRTSRRI